MEEEGPRLSLGGWKELSQIARRGGGHPSKGPVRGGGSAWERAAFSDLGSLLSRRAGSLVKAESICRGMEGDEAWSPVAQKLGNWSTEF